MLCNLKERYRSGHNGADSKSDGRFIPPRGFESHPLRQFSILQAMRDRSYWNLAELTVRLQGKYRDHPHPQQVGDALRKLGWGRERGWGKGFDGARVWLLGAF